MLSRTAMGLFWMSRYVERAENTARLLDAGRRMEALPATRAERSTEWESIVIASGCKSTFPHDIEAATQDQVVGHLFFDLDTPSSIASCLTAARENARAMRNAITSEVWDATNEALARFRTMSPDAPHGDLAERLDWVKERGALVRGAIDGTLLRNEGYQFIELGKWLERMDATARLLDVKYHVLLPHAYEVGQGVDYLQWLQILRAAGAARAYRHIYRRAIDAKGVADLLVLNPLSPRSLVTCSDGIAQSLTGVGVRLAPQRAVLNRAYAMRDALHRLSVDEIIEFGLHEWLTERIAEANMLATEISKAYGFDAPLEAEESQVQSQ
ncbi:MAG: alpha-E domain-containing protein [Pseudomonadota bacterium]